MPGPGTVRFGGNTSCVTVWTDTGELLIFGAGTGIRSLGQKLLAARGSRPLEASIFLSHFHWDHIQGLPFFHPLYHTENRFHIFGFRPPTGSLRETVERQMQSPHFPLASRGASARCDFHEIQEEQIETSRTRIISRRLNHPQGCLGFRIECNGTVVVYGTDHEPDGGESDRNLLSLAAGADLLILDAQFTRTEYESHRRGWGHGNWEHAVEIAGLAGARELLLFHHDPDRTDAELECIVKEAQTRFPAVSAAAEGTKISLSKQRFPAEFEEEPLPYSRVLIDPQSALGSAVQSRVQEGA